MTQPGLKSRMIVSVHVVILHVHVHGTGRCKKDPVLSITSRDFGLSNILI